MSRATHLAIAEPLEARRLLAVSVVVVDGVLTLTGDAADDRVSVLYDTRPNEFLVGTNAEPILRFDADSIGRVSITGGAGNDAIQVGTLVNRRVVIDGGDGNDTIDSGSGSDLLFGGAGDDLILANAGRDVVYGGAGQDTLSGGTGPDVLIGDAGNDLLTGSAGDDRLFGDDVLGGAVAGDAVGDDTLGGSAGRDTLYGGLGADVLSGGSGSQDLVNYSSRTENLSVLIGVAGQSGAGGSAEGDTVTADTEKVNGGSGDDRLVGGGGNNVLWGGAGNDTLEGQGGDDLIFGVDGDDLLRGGSGNDTIQGGLGADDMAGQDGLDTLDYSDKGPNEPIVIGLGNQADDGVPDLTPPVTDPESRQTPLAERDNARSDFETIIGGAGDDRITAAGVEGIPNYNVLLIGGPGNDVLEGSRTGNDTLVGGPGRDFLEGREGNDVFDLLDGESDTAHGGPGTDTATADAIDVLTGMDVLLSIGFGLDSVGFGLNLTLTFGPNCVIFMVRLPPP